MSKMAELQVLNWELEVRYFPHPQKLAGLRYEIFFRYKGEPIVRDELLKRAPKIWEDRTPGAFLAHQREACSLVPTLRQVLETDQPMFWRSEEGDITLAFYPGVIFPDLGRVDNNRPNIERNEDPIAVVALVDSFNFGDEFAYQGDGPALVLHVMRPALQAFYDELQAELVAFLEEYGPLGDPPAIKEDL